MTYTSRLPSRLDVQTMTPEGSGSAVPPGPEGLLEEQRVTAA